MKIVRAIAAMLLLASLCVCSEAATRYKIIDLGALGGRSTANGAYGINNLGHVVGTGMDGSQAFLWTQDRGLVYLDDLSGAQCMAYDINDADEIVGYNGMSTRWASDGTISSLDHLGGWGGSAQSINNSGVVVGRSVDTAGYTFAFRLTASGISSLGALGGWDSRAYCINEPGDVVGVARDADNRRRAFLWNDGPGMVDLGTLGGPEAEAYAINDARQVVGRSLAVMSGINYMHACLWQTNGAVIDLQPALASSSCAYGINSRSQVVGTSDRGAFLWEPSTGTTFLRDLVSNSDWALRSANAINDSGWIVGSGYRLGTTTSHGLLLIPVPEPGSLLVLGSGLVGLLAFRRRNR